MENQKQLLLLKLRWLLFCVFSLLLLTANAEPLSQAVTTENATSDILSPRSHFSLAAKYAQHGYQASLSGHWQQSREDWEQAVEHLDKANAPDRNRAVFYYELGHVAGITCQFDIAEEFIEKSYQLEKSTNMPYVLTLVEMFRLYFDQKQYKMASIYFEAALPNLRAANAEQTTPARFTRLLDEYANTLNHLDKNQLAVQIQKQSQNIKTRSGIDSEKEQRTLYGSRCEKSNHKKPIIITQSSAVNIRMGNIRSILKSMKKIHP